MWLSFDAEYIWRPEEQGLWANCSSAFCDRVPERQENLDEEGAAQVGIVSGPFRPLGTIPDDFGSFCQQYRTHARRLRQTGKGLKPEPEGTDGSQADSSLQELKLLHYVPPSGPDDNTLEVARNIWGMFFEQFFDPFDVYW
jgi:hypothetical protein